jgi:hypothetical protein
MEAFGGFELGTKRIPEHVCFAGLRSSLDSIGAALPPFALSLVEGPLKECFDPLSTNGV